MIRFERISKSFAGVSALTDVSFEVSPGELVALVGPSGCGKTTLLKLVNRLVHPSSGTVEVAGRPVEHTDVIALRRSIGYVLQHFGLFPHLTVSENVAVVPELLGWPASTVLARVTELLQLVGLNEAGLQKRLPSQLSGGQQQRVALARALAAKPRLMLLDEAFGALDPITRDELQTEYCRLHNQLGLTTLMVTHDMNEALLMADRIAVMQQGHLAAIDTPERLLSHSDNAVVRWLLSTPERQMDRLSALRKQVPSQEAPCR